MPSNASYPRLSTAQAAEQREFALPRHRACPVSVAPAQSPPMFTGWRWPRRRRRPTVSHPACRRCRPPAVSPEPSSAALRTVAGQRRFFTAVLAAGEHSSPVTAASTPRSAALRPRLRTLFVEQSLRSHENCPAEGLPRRPRALTSLLTPETAKKRGRAKGQATS